MEKSTFSFLLSDGSEIDVLFLHIKDFFEDNGDLKLDKSINKIKRFDKKYKENKKIIFLATQNENVKTNVYNLDEKEYKWFKLNLNLLLFSKLKQAISPNILII